MLKRSIIVLAAMLGASPGHAACQQGDIAGDWQVYSQGYQRGFEPYWNWCMLKVKPNGVIDFNG